MTRDLIRQIYIFVLLLVAPVLHAQGIAPIITEYGHGKANGTFTIGIPLPSASTTRMVACVQDGGAGACS